MPEALVGTKLAVRVTAAAAEEIMVARDILLAELTGGRVHLCHPSTRGAVELMRRAKERGLRGTAEGAPHPPRLTQAARRRHDTPAKDKPPPPGGAGLAARRPAPAGGR